MSPLEKSPFKRPVASSAPVFANGARTAALAYALNQLSSQDSKGRSYSELSPDELEDLSESLRKDATRLLNGIRNKDPDILGELNIDQSDDLQMLAAEYDLPRIATIAFSNEVGATLYDIGTVLPVELAKNLVTSKGVLWKAVSQTVLERIFGPSMHDVNHAITCSDRCSAYVKVNDNVYQVYPK